MLPFANMVDLFADEFTGLRRCRFALPAIAPGPLQS